MATRTPATLFGKRLKQRRLKLRLTHKELAKRARCDSSAISLLENGKRKPGLDMVVKLSRGLGCPAWKLVREIERDLP